ncbi:Hypothetical predicted protein [Octopus vulgaris]|uniref:Uncharacterized protein n=1 Tax=Octopus vulgaris TaxID=6645 RepID=A0AA36B4C2_OCTVU|nr:Hypothetical predicted protein [Octopus vulgaris]
MRKKFLFQYISENTLGMEHNVGHMSTCTESAYIYALLEISDNSLTDLCPDATSHTPDLVLSSGIVRGSLMYTCDFTYLHKKKSQGFPSSDIALCCDDTVGSRDQFDSATPKFVPVLKKDPSSLSRKLLNSSGIAEYRLCESWKDKRLNFTSDQKHNFTKIYLQCRLFIPDKQIISPCQMNGCTFAQDYQLWFDKH